ncbi:lysophospholipase L1-like esterase [Panacagrimonas perspica]|uniref:Lysophospholipase L1-like esterase n=1 Tax=Panacagrimonas perspica TaxID=381431 RepID=A0A4R7PAL2_9GAMM|nr:GDSL-type esterase/lipase family protein [Panacagrimonas perspica]TDU30968.1 lysophospholipase L1-like esterase [Panacagrimonas perspica]THD01880.1 hypothetical protein B1810_17940 [Panacagrimonas perspica]
MTEQANEREQEWEDDRDWPNLWRFHEENARLLASGEPVDVVLLGDSITEGWSVADPDFFATSSTRLLNRGITGQTSPQMLLRFMADVVALRPRAVHLLAGTNDVAGNTGPISFEAFRNNVSAMIAIGRAHGLRIILGTPLPTTGFPWNRAISNAVPRIAEMRDWLIATAASTDLILADYYPVLLAPGGAMDPAFTEDGVHPSTAGYQQLREVATRSFEAALR